MKKLAKMAPVREPKMCPIWPHCHCIVQGYVNRQEKDSCGRPPKTPEDAIFIRNDFVGAMLDY